MPCTPATARFRPLDDLVRIARRALVARFQVDVEPAAVAGVVLNRAGPDEGARRRRHPDRFMTSAAIACWRWAMAAEGNILGGIGHADDQPGILLRQETLGHRDIEQGRRRPIVSTVKISVTV